MPHDKPPRATVSVGPLIVIDIVLILAVLIVAGASFSKVPPEAVAEASAPERPIPLFTYFGAGYAAFVLAMIAILPPLIDAGIRRLAAGKIAPNERIRTLWRGYVVRHLLVMMVLQGAAMINAFAYWIESQLISLPATGIMLVLMALQIPSQDRVTRWIEAQERTIQNTTV